MSLVVKCLGELPGSLMRWFRPLLVRVRWLLLFSRRNSDFYSFSAVGLRSVGVRGGVGVDSGRVCKGAKHQSGGGGGEEGEKFRS